MQSAIFGNMTAVIQKLYAVRARFHAKAAEIKQFVRLHRIENDLKRRIEDYFLTHWSVSKGVDSDEVGLYYVMSWTLCVLSFHSTDFFMQGFLVPYWLLQNSAN